GVIPGSSGGPWPSSWTQAELQGKIEGYAVSGRLFPASPFLRGLQAVGHLCRDRRCNRRVGRTDRLFSLAAWQGRGRALAEPRDHRGLRWRDAAASRRDFHQVEADGPLLAV